MRSSKIFAFLTASILIVSCLIVILSIWLVIDLPKRAEISFGPAAAGLGFSRRIQLSARLLVEQDALLNPANPDGAKQAFQIQPAETTFSITDRLEKAGLVSNAGTLRDYLIYSGLDHTIQAGEFELEPGMTPLQIAWAIQDATPDEVTFHILPGWRLEEIAAGLPTSGLEFSPQSFLSAVYDPPDNLAITQKIPPGASLEGFLYPDGYRFQRKISVEAFLEIILQDFDLKIDLDTQEGFQHQGLSLYQAVTLASIVQREAVQEDEMPLIASVFLNRLNAGMNLDTDPSVQYALGYDQKAKTWWKNPLSLDDLQINSPYNTYQNAGLPPGPISNPGLSALRAVAYPAQTPYYYFRSACDGSGRHRFAETFEQHQQNACPE